MVNWEKIKKEWETTNISFKELADKYEMKDSTIRSRKNREKWQRNATKGVATKKTNVATNRNRGAPKGNQNAVGNTGGAPARNQNAVTHGFFQKFLPVETLEIIETMNERGPADLIWDQIQIQYAAIIRAQRIMHVTDKNEIIKELKKRKDTQFGEEIEYEFQFAWERQAQLLTAQSRAIGELRSSIRQFVEMADEADERRLKLEQMQLNIDKSKIEIRKENGEDEEVESDGFIEALGEAAAEVWGDEDA